MDRRIHLHHLPGRTAVPCCLWLQMVYDASERFPAQGSLKVREELVAYLPDTAYQGRAHRGRVEYANSGERYFGGDSCLRGLHNARCVCLPHASARVWTLTISTLKLIAFDTDDPAARYIPRRTRLLDVKSQCTLAMAKACIEQCAREHERCRVTSNTCCSCSCY